ncbi:sensor histidine kinase [Sporosarcina sp. YIM B06819]|uniref:sensor histidine kinase n=1 Tax=Sporosarcina sp. YIM B06819 TaxID=3081769 RepID=UPI00298CBC55|nr:ATP-binding protein [Sporosarcina sp. YIM B06819]
MLKRIESMSVKPFFKKASVQFCIILLCMATLTAGVLYITHAIYSDQQLKDYKMAYYTEQTYRLSSFLGSNIVGDLDEKENMTLFDNLAKSFSIRYEILDHQREEKIHETAFNTSTINNVSYVDAPIISNGKLLGYLRAYYDIKSLEMSPSLRKFQNSLDNQWRIVANVTMLVLIVSSLIIAKIYSKSMKPTVTSALTVLQGKRDIHVPKSGTLEMDYLVDSLNSVLVEFNNMENWRKQMMEDLTHEIRTPLTSVQLMMEAIIDGVYPTSTENLQKIYKEVDRLSRLILNVQDLSEAEGARFGLDITKVNIIPLIKGTYDGFLFVAAQKNIKLYLKLPNKPCVAELDADRFVQVITNLISNALKYTLEGGTVEIGVEINSDEIVFYCEDNGIGISEEDQILVFNRFYRVEKSRTSENGGLGIGLNISHALAQAHGWHIVIESKLAEGSKFSVKIPLNIK